MAILAFCVAIIGLFVFDSTELIHYEYDAILTDKWHEESCSPIIDGSGNYYGDSCSDEYTVVLNVDGERLERHISNGAFKQLLIGSHVEYSFDLGKLGFEHNISIISEK